MRVCGEEGGGRKMVESWWLRLMIRRFGQRRFGADDGSADTRVPFFQPSDVGAKKGVG